MASKRKYRGSARQRQAKAATRHKIAALKKRGLLKTVATKPGKRPGGSVYSQLKKFAAVIEGKASVISAPPKTRKAYKGQLPIKHKKIVVPKSPTAKRPPKIDKKTGLIKFTHRIGERKLQSYTLPKNANTRDIPRGPNITYAIQMNNWTSKARFKRYEDLLEFLKLYDLKNFMDAIEIVIDGEAA